VNGVRLWPARGSRSKNADRVLASMWWQKAFQKLQSTQVRRGGDNPERHGRFRIPRADDSGGSMYCG